MRLSRWRRIAWRLLAKKEVDRIEFEGERWRRPYPLAGARSWMAKAILQRRRCRACKVSLTACDISTDALASNPRLVRHTASPRALPRCRRYPELGNRDAVAGGDTRRSLDTCYSCCNPSTCRSRARSFAMGGAEAKRVLVPQKSAPARIRVCASRNWRAYGLGVRGPSVERSAIGSRSTITYSAWLTLPRPTCASARR